MYYLYATELCLNYYITQRMGWRSGEVEHVRGDYKLKKE